MRYLAEMTCRLLFLVATFGLFAIVASFYDELELELNLDDGYNVALPAVARMLWKSFEADIRENSNVLFFATPFARDMSFISEVLDKEMRGIIMESLHLYDNFDNDLETTESRMTDNDVRFTTIFHGELDDMGKRLLVNHAYSRRSESRDGRFEITIHNKDDIEKRQSKLFSAIRKSRLGENCDVRFCSWEKILHDDVDPFSIFTLASWKITSIDGFTFRAQGIFSNSGSGWGSNAVETVQGSGDFDYAEFTYWYRYPRINGCIGRVLRLPYQVNLNLTFVIPSADKMCGSPEDLWKNVQNINLNRLKYTNSAMFVSIPLFNVSASIDLKMKLNGTVLAMAFDEPSSRLYNTEALQAAEVIFNPRVQENMPAPTMPEDDALIFKVDRPFYFSLFHRISPTPIIAGFVNNPGCITNCLPTFA